MSPASPSTRAGPPPKSGSPRGSRAEPGAGRLLGRPEAEDCGRPQGARDVHVPRDPIAVRTVRARRIAPPVARRTELIQIPVAQPHAVVREDVGAVDGNRRGIAAGEDSRAVVSRDLATGKGDAGAVDEDAFGGGAAHRGLDLD